MEKQARARPRGEKEERHDSQVDGTRCIGCGMCAAAVPAVFGIRGRVSAVLAQPRTAAEEAGAFDAANGCPVNAIRARR